MNKKIYVEYYNKGDKKPCHVVENEEEAKKDLFYYLKRYAMFESLRMSNKYTDYENDGHKLTFIDKSNGYKAIFYNVTLRG